MGIRSILGMALYALPLMISVMYSWHKLLGKHIDFSDYKTYIVTLVMSLFSASNFLITNKYYRMIIITIILIILFKIMFNESYRKSIIIPIFCQFLTILSETIYTLILILILKGDIEKILLTSWGTLLTNTSVAVILFLIVHIRIITKLYTKILEVVEKIKDLQLVLTCFVLMLITNILVMSSYYKIEFTYYFLFNTLMIIICMVIIIHSFKTQNNYNKVSDKYNVAKNSLRDYEAMMTKYRVANHENKNLLLTVRAMTINKEKNIPEYIDSMIENKFEDDERLLFKMSVIPTGGLRATMYSEILKIKERGINYNLNIDRKISTIDLIELDTNTIIDMCKIIGVFVDNSIEAVRRLKTRNINIDMYILEDQLCIKVSNNYRGNIDINRINDAGYTTKGKGHGYGLCLVRNVIENNSLLDNTTEITKNIFSQVLKIKYKKNH